MSPSLSVSPSASPSPSPGVPIEGDILPKRPTKISLGFTTTNGNELIQVFTGRSGLPKANMSSKQARIKFYDDVKMLNNYKLPDGSVYLGKTTDEYIKLILAEIKDSDGNALYNSSNWTKGGVSLIEPGLQTIPICWWGGNTAGYEIMTAAEAEGGRFYQNDEGYFVFENRQHYNTYQKEKVWDFNYNNLTDIDFPNDEDQIVNKVRVIVNPRVKKSSQILWESSGSIEIAGKSTEPVWANFEDPCGVITTPVANTDFKANSISDGSGVDKTNKITGTFVKWAESMLMNIYNDDAGTVYITNLQVRGEPYIIQGATIIEQLDQDSIDLYGETLLEVDNKYLQDDHYADALAISLIAKYKDPFHKMVLNNRAVPQLQLGDIVAVFNRKNDVYYVMRIIKISTVFNLGDGLTQELTVREVLDSEIADLFEIEESLIEGVDIISA